MKNAIIIIGLIAIFFISAKVVETPQKRTEVVFVCNSAPEVKKILDVYFKMDYKLEQMTTQLVSISSFHNSGLINYGGTFKREYLLILYK